MIDETIAVEIYEELLETLHPSVISDEWSRTDVVAWIYQATRMGGFNSRLHSRFTEYKYGDQLNIADRVLEIANDV